MNPRDPRERWRWEVQREEETRDVEEGGRYARELRDLGDPRWGTGGMGGGRGAARPRPSANEEAAIVGARSAARGPYVGRGPRGYRRSDERIREEVCDWFTREGYLDPSNVDVSVQNGEVVLSGTVSTRAQKRLAEDVAELVPGVVEVHNRLRIDPAFAQSGRPAPATPPADGPGRAEDRSGAR